MKEKIYRRLQKKWRKFLLFLIRDAIEEFMHGIEGNEPPSVCLDYHVKSPSWAVVHFPCGKATYMKFVELKHEHIMDVYEYLKQFAVSDIDGPPSMKHWMEVSILNKESTR